MPFRPAKSRSRQSFLRAPLPILGLAALASASFLSPLRAADTEIDVNAAATDLTNAASYTPASAPSAAFDITFAAATAYATPSAFTINSNVAFGSLNDLNTTALTISNTGAAATTLTLGGTGDVVTGSNSADLIYVANGGSLTVNGGSGSTALGIALAQSGNFNVAGTATVSSVITGASTAVLTKTGNGTLTLSGANTFSGGLIYSAGTLKLGSSSVGTAGTVGSNGALTSGAVGTGALTLGGNGFLGLDLNGQTLGNRFVITNNNDTVTNNSANLATVTGALDGSLNGNVISSFAVGGTGDILWTGQISRTNQTLGLTKNSNNTVTFAQAAGNVGIGTVTINAGTVGAGVTGANGAFCDSVTVAGGTFKYRPDLGVASGGGTWGGQINGTLMVNTGTVDLNGSTGQNSRQQQLIGTGGTITNTSTTAAVLGIAARDTNQTREYDGLIKDGAGTVALDFTNQGTQGSGRVNFLTGANTYSGGTTIGFATVRLGNNTALGTGLVTLQSNTTATLDLNGFSFANNLANSITGATITNSSATAATVSTGFNPTGAGSFTISDFTVNGTGDINWTGAIRRTNNTGTTTKSGTNTLTLAGAGGDYTGMAYTVSAGTLAFKLTGGTFNSGNIVNNSAVTGTNASGVTQTISNVISGTGTFTQTGAGTTILNAVNTYAGGTTVNAGILQLNVGGGNGTLTGTLTINAGGTVKTNAADALGYNGGNGTTTAVNVNGGTFDNGVAGNNGYITAFNLTGGSVTSSGGGSINFAASAAVTLSSLASGTTSVFSAPITLRNNTALVVTTAAGTTPSGIDLSISGAIGQNGGAGAIDKEGAGTLALSGTSNYSGTTNVGAGRLLVNGSVTGTGAVTVTSGATLGGSGSLAGAATLGGTVAPGSAVGTVGMLTLTSTSGATISASGIYLADIGGATSDNLLLSGGALTITTGATLTFNTLGTLTAPSYVLANYASETGAFTVTNLPAGYTLSYGATELDLVTAVPEPSTWAAGVLCLGALGLRMRRRLGGLFAGRQAA